MMQSPIEPGNSQSPPAAKIGRPPQWTESRSRKLARLYMYTTLPIEKIIKVLEDGVFKPGRNSAQKTLHNMLGHDPRYLRPEGREEMNARIGGLSASNSRRRAKEPRSDKGLQTYPSSAASERSVVDEAVSVNPYQDPSMRYGFESSPAPGAGLSPAPPHSDAGNISAGPWSDSSVGWGSPPSSAVEPGPGFSPAFFSPRPLAQTSTMFSASTTASTPSIRNLKQRMSVSSNTFAKQVSTLIRQFTIGMDIDKGQGDGTGVSPAGNVRVPSNQEAYTADNTSEATYALPGEFFAAYHFSQFYPGTWQDIALSISQIDDFWVVGPEGHFSEAAMQIFQQPTPTNLSARDCFGNTPLHLAARNSDCSHLLRLIPVCTNNLLLATNTANQTFLHVLAPWWFFQLEQPSPPPSLIQLINELQRSCPTIFTMCDVYGRTFFHRLHNEVTDHNAVANIIQTFDRAMMPRRDAFGSKPASDGMLAAAPRRAPTLSPLPEEILNSPTGTTAPTQVVDMFTQHHAGLLRTISAAHNNPATEDVCGRNGLHCLAEVIIDSDTLQERCTSLTTRRPLKRKYDRKDRPEGENGSETPLGRRLQLLKGLLAGANDEAGAPGGVVDVNHYDLNGNTVLMAFVEKVTDQDEDRHRNLAGILQQLLGAGARIEARNRRGETALLMAARLGRKTALRTLLEKGANVHARDAEGRGVLQIIDETCSGASDDINLYGRLEACRVILTGRYKEDWGGEISQSPSVIDEWRVRGPKREAKE